MAGYDPTFRRPVGNGDKDPITIVNQKRAKRFKMAAGGNTAQGQMRSKITNRLKTVKVTLPIMPWDEREPNE